MRLAWCYLLLSAIATAGCGVVESTSLQWKVERTLKRAEDLGAARSAPYELTAGQRYLKKGKEEAGYADYEAAVDYMHKAQAMAKQAVERAEAAQKMKAPIEAPDEPPPKPVRKPRPRPKPAPSIVTPKSEGK